MVEEGGAAEDLAASSAMQEAGRAEGLASVLGVIDGLIQHARPLTAPSSSEARAQHGPPTRTPASPEERRASKELCTLVAVAPHLADHVPT